MKAEIFPYSLRFDKVLKNGRSDFETFQKVLFDDEALEQAQSISVGSGKNVIESI